VHYLYSREFNCDHVHYLYSREFNCDHVHYLYSREFNYSTKKDALIIYFCSETKIYILNFI
jgi:hypothetical protein